MTRYRLSLAMLCGIGLAVLATVSLRAPLLWVAAAAWYFVYPGIRFADFLAWPDSVVLIMAGNAALYSILGFLIVWGLTRAKPAPSLRHAPVWFAFPFAGLVVLAFYPSHNPMLPGGMLKLERQATELRNEFPDAMRVEQARTVLRSKNIYFDEAEASTGPILLGDGKSTMVASSGDRLLKGDLETKSSAFPCNYTISVDLLFDASGKLKQRNIRPAEGACL